MNFVKCIPAVLVLFTLLFPPLTPSVKADSFTHDFGAGLPAVTYTGSTQCTTSDGYTYLCGGSAEFGFVSSVIYLKLNNTNDYVTVSPATENLTEIAIQHTGGTGFTNIKVYLSNDGSSWWGPVPDANMAYNRSNYITAYFGKSAYYVKIVNTNGGKPINIRSIQYTTTDCNCFIYTPE